MSATGNSVPFVWIIRTNPQDEASLFGMPVGGGKLGAFVFTQREYVEEFTRTFTGIPHGSVYAIVEAPDLRRILAEQPERGVTHVVTDPILGSLTYMDQRTLTIEEYLRRSSH